MINNYNRKDIFISLLFGIILCLPITGFIFGFISCSDCENTFFGFLGRVFIGFVYTFITIITFGEPWKTEAGIATTNIRIYVLLSFVIITTITYLYRKRKRNKTAANKV